MESLAWIVVLIVLGAVFGSFAGATVWRIKKDKTIVNDRSECEHCHHKLAALDLVPIISWIMLRGRCRYCHKAIGWTALALEIGLAAVFVTSFVFWPDQLISGLDWLSFGLWLVSLVLLAILFVYDLKWFILPDVVMYPLIASGLSLFLIRAVEQNWSLEQAFIQFLLGLLPVTGLYGLLFIISKGRWIGDSDVIYGVFVGLVLGWQLGLLVVFIANLLGLLVILPQLVTSKLERNAQIPFGPYLITATFICFLFGQQLVNWYLNWVLV